MKLSEMMKIFEQDFPPYYAEEWDNVGLLVGDEEAEIYRVLISLDASDEALDYARVLGADLILTHHPLLFKPLRKVTEQHFISRRVRCMIRENINCYAMHTNFDLARMADLNAADLGLLNPAILTEAGENREGQPIGYGRIGKLQSPLPLEDFAGKVREAMELPGVRVYGELSGLIRTVAVSSGAGKMSIDDAIKKGADVLVTGDLDYHSAIDAVSRGLSMIDAGHYGTELTFIRFMEGYVEEHFPELETYSMAIRQPYQIV